MALKNVTLRDAKMREIYFGHGIRGDDDEGLAGSHRLQDLAGFQNWQRTQEPCNIQGRLNLFLLHRLTAQS